LIEKGFLMSTFRAFIRRLVGLVKNSRDERELSAELESHLQMHLEDNLRAGMTPERARREALMKLGGVEQAKESYRERRGLPFVENFLRDLRFGLRTLRKNPGFTFVVVFTLALGIGANTAIFSVMESQLWRPLPFFDSERLVDVHTVLQKNPKQWDMITNPVCLAWLSESHSFAGLGAYNYPSHRNLTADRKAEQALVMALTPSLFDTLGVSVERGRNFSLQETTPGNDHVAILSQALWQNEFGSARDVLGKPIAIDGVPYTVVGIAPSSLKFEFLADPALYVPLAIDPAAKVERGIYMVGRLAPGTTTEQARTELDGILRRQTQDDRSRREDGAGVTNLRETWTGYAARPLYFFSGAILLVLLIACVNNAGLLLARGLARQREFALRATLGASRSALLRQSLAESLLLSLTGGTAGAILGAWGASGLAKIWRGESLPRDIDSFLDLRVLLFIAGASIISALAMGTIPSFFSSRVDVIDTLRKSAGGLAAGRSQHRTRRILVALEVALALVLLFGAGLFLASFIRLQEAPRGFDAPGALTFRIDLRGQSYAKPEQQQRYFSVLRDQLRSLPGVDSVTLGSSIPLQGDTIYTSINVAGRPPQHEHGTGVTLYAIEPNFFEALRMRLLAGRNLDVHDAASSQHVVILNRNAAHTLFGSEDPLGKVLEFPPGDDRRDEALPDLPAQIVGVVENAQEFGANEIPFDMIYVPFAQHPDRAGTFVVSADVPRGALLGAIRDAAYALDKDQPIFDIKTMDDRIADSVRGARYNALLVGCLAAVALALVAVGIFGTVAYFVQQRTQEFGIRLALGATPAHVLRHALSRTFLTGAAGLVGGVAASLALGRILGSAMYLVPHEHTGLLYGVKIYDPFSMFVACLLLLVILFSASFLPARRAMRVDPMVALRYE
jgi:predicted permease